MNDYRVDEFGRLQPASRIPLLLLALLLGLMALVSFPTPGRSADINETLRQTVNIFSRACEIDGGTVDLTFEPEEDGSIRATHAGCSTEE